MPARKPRPKGVPGYVRAAFAYADLEQTDMAAALNISVSTLNRWLSVGPPTDRLPDVAQLCGVPLDFLERGFHAERGADGRRLRQLERQIISLSERLSELERAAEEHPIGDVLEQLGALEQQVQDGQTRTAQPHAVGDRPQKAG